MTSIISHLFLKKLKSNSSKISEIAIDVVPCDVLYWTKADDSYNNQGKSFSWKTTVWKEYNCVHFGVALTYRNVNDERLSVTC